MYSVSRAYLLGQRALASDQAWETLEVSNEPYHSTYLTVVTLRDPSVALPLGFSGVLVLRISFFER